jgi:acyl-CoA thioester hydrolase
MASQSQLEQLLGKYPVVIALPVFWGDQDAFGHVNNNAYFRWFESARIALSQRIGLFELFKAERIGPILASVSCDYRRQVTFPDTIHAAIRVTKVGRTSLGLEHAIFSQSQQAIAAEGTSTIVIFRLVVDSRFIDVDHRPLGGVIRERRQDLAGCLAQKRGK